MGLFGITVPEEYGGLDLDPVSFALVFEEIARGWMGIAGILGSHSLACRMIAMHGTEEQKQRYLPELATGERRTGIGLTEPDAGTDLQGIRTTARLRRRPLRRQRHARCGSPTPGYADPLPVLVKTDPAATPAHKGMSVLLVEADTPGFEVTKDIPKLGYKGTESCEILLDDVRVPGRAPARRRRGPRHAAGALRRWSGAGSTSPPARSASPSAPTTRRWPTPSSARRSASRSPTSRRSSSSSAELGTQVQAARLMAYWAADAVRRGRADGATGHGQDLLLRGRRCRPPSTR